MVYEGIILVINIFVAILAFDPDSEDRDSDFRWRLGEGVIILYAVFYTA